MTAIKEYKTKKGEVLLYKGVPQLTMLDELAEGSGDVWHSSLDQGFTNSFKELVYQSAVYWWYINDFENLNSSVSWRINENAFVIRKSIWEQIDGFDHQYSSPYMKGLDLGFNLLKNKGGIPLYIKGLFKTEENAISINTNDRYLFYSKYFKVDHSIYMLFRKGVFNFFKEFKAFKYAKHHIKEHKSSRIIKTRELKEISGKPSVSLVIPTMRRQEHTQLLLEDHRKQTYLISEAVIVDATPEDERDEKYYRQENFPFNVKVHWQTTKGSCVARNEAIEMCTGDYIIFADDDIRIFPDFVENHIRFLQTYDAVACNGLDIMADHVHQDLTDLDLKLNKLGKNRWKAGVTSMFSNANSIVKKEWVEKIKGNDINFDGGYGEDSDVGLSLLKNGAAVLFNPFSPNLHLKPPVGGYRWWGNQSKLLGKKRKQQPWELGRPVKWIKPVPSPTITYGVLKHFKDFQIKEWRKKHFFIYLFKGSKDSFLIRLLKLPLKKLQFSKSIWYAKKLMELGPRFK